MSFPFFHLGLRKRSWPPSSLWREWRWNSSICNPSWLQRFLAWSYHMFVRMSMANAAALIMWRHMSTHCQSGMQQLLMFCVKYQLDTQQPTIHFPTLKSVMFALPKNLHTGWYHSIWTEQLAAMRNLFEASGMVDIHYPFRISRCLM